MSFSSVLSGIAIASDQSDTALRADLRRVAAMRIYFGHQSVGGNILDGVKQLSTRTNIPVQIAEYPNAQDIASGTLGHVRVGKNGNPEGKLASFEQAIGTAPTSLDVAIIKFCYVDFSVDADVQALFSSYVHTVERIKQRHPQLTVIHTTVPLTVVQTGPKAFIKRLLGRAPYGVLENMRREEYNSLIRKKYAKNAPLFDIAWIETTSPEGIVTSTSWNGNLVPYLIPEYTHDGSHLNSQGQLILGRELVRVLASIK